VSRNVNIRTIWIPEKVEPQMKRYGKKRLFRYILRKRGFIYHSPMNPPIDPATEFHHCTLVQSRQNLVRSQADGRMSRSVVSQCPLSAAASHAGRMTATPTAKFRPLATHLLRSDGQLLNVHAASWRFPRMDSSRWSLSPTHFTGIFSIVSSIESSCLRKVALPQVYAGTKSSISLQTVLIISVHIVRMPMAGLNNSGAICANLRLRAMIHGRILRM
jgi:hypothetical protein